MKLILNRFLLLILTFIYMVFIWLQSSYFNPESVAGYSSLLSKNVIKFIGISLELAHFFEFGILYLLLIFVFLSFGRLTKGKEYLAFILSFLYGVLDEIHQSFVPFRSASFGDLLKDTIGIIIIGVIVHRAIFIDVNSKMARLIKKIVPGSL